MRIGLKLWSTNERLVEPARSLYDASLYDYLELFVVPQSADLVAVWEVVDIPFVLHSPHSGTGFNFSLPDRIDQNRRMLETVERYRQALHADTVIFHPGTNGSLNETIRQMRIFAKDLPEIFAAAVVENKPLEGLGGEVCVGSTPEEMRRIRDETGAGTCIDIGHALAAAASHGRDGYVWIDDFLALGPRLIHLSDGIYGATLDRHLHLGRGTYDLEGIIDKVCQRCDPGIAVTIETEKTWPDRLDDFVEDARRFRELYEAGRC